MASIFSVDFPFLASRANDLFWWVKTLPVTSLPAGTELNSVACLRMKIDKYILVGHLCMAQLRKLLLIRETKSVTTSWISFEMKSSFVWCLEVRGNGSCIDVCNLIIGNEILDMVITTSITSLTK